MPTEWAHALLKPWNFFDETPTLGEKKNDSPRNRAGFYRLFRLACGGNRLTPVARLITCAAGRAVVGSCRQIPANAACHASTLSVGKASQMKFACRCAASRLVGGLMDNNP